MQPLNGSPSRLGIDSREFQDWLSRATPSQKSAAVYQLLHDLLGEQPRQEVGVYNADDEIYLYLLPPQIREDLRFQANPDLERELEQGATEPMIPLQELRQQLSI